MSKRTIVALTYGYGITVPLGLMALQRGPTLTIAALLFLLGFCLTLVVLES